MAPYAANFRQAVDHNSLVFNYPVIQSRVKNYLHGLKISSLMANGVEVSDELSAVCKMILKLRSQCPISHPGDTQKMKFLRAAAVVCDWKSEPLSRVAAH